MTWLVIALLAGTVATVYFASHVKAALKWSSMRNRLLKEARAEGLDGAWEGPSLHVSGWSWTYIERNLTLVARRGTRTITVTPMSLGWRKEDPPYTWWWFRLETAAPSQAFFSFYVAKRRDSDYKHPSQRDIPTGDDAFDAAFRVYRYENETPEFNQRTITAANRSLARPTARDILREFIIGDTDSVNLSPGSITASRRRDGLSIHDAIAQIDRLTHLADIVDEAFVERLYR
ncbi:MAG: hypothetical protein L6Q76_27165 [Polyangiaceae bacterium]|nr:hypothetical protein [Polyangiaceae bacterium]